MDPLTSKLNDINTGTISNNKEECHDLRESHNGALHNKGAKVINKTKNKNKRTKKNKNKKRINTTKNTIKKDELEISNFYQGPPRLLILDVNGVLCHKVFKPDNQEDDKCKDLDIKKTEKEIECLKLERHDVYFRPETRIFLKKCYEIAQVGFWSSTTEINASKILKYILTNEQWNKTKFFWYRDRVSLDPDYGINPDIKISDTIKNLSTLIGSPYINAN